MPVTARQQLRNDMMQMQEVFFSSHVCLDAINCIIENHWHLLLKPYYFIQQTP
jgi:hypothetical protein